MAGEDENMRALTLWEPWASLTAKGQKKIETRSWKAPDELIGQRIAIHAAKRMPVIAKIFCREFSKLLGLVTYTGSWLYYLEHGVGSFGKVVATAKLVDCKKILPDTPNYAFYGDSKGETAIPKDSLEYAFGDYTPGRYAWILEDIKPLDEPIPVKGKQRLWEWKNE